MIRHRPLSGTAMLAWTGLGLSTGLVAGFALSEWLGDVNRRRIRRVARRFQTPAPAPALTAAAGVRAAREALEADATLRDVPLEVVAVGRGTVELRGWVPSRAARTRAARLVRGVPGIDNVINSVLVRGEDDRRLGDPDATEQPA